MWDSTKTYKAIGRWTRVGREETDGDWVAGGHQLQSMYRDVNFKLIFNYLMSF